MKLFLSITSIFFSINLFAQDCLTGKILCKDGSIISFATIAQDNGNGTVSDSLGFFSLCADTLNFPLHLTIKAVDCSEKVFIAETAKENLIITLEPKLIELESITVYSEQSLRNKSSVSAVTISKDQIEKRIPLHIGDLLEDKAGFTQKSGYQAPITLRGLSGKRMLVLRNGNRRFSSYPAGFMSHTINIYDLERIDVEKGPASVSYGAGAIAGIINLIDKPPFKQKGFDGKITIGYGTNNNEKDLLACGGWSNGKFSVKTGLRYRTAGNFKYADKKEAQNSFYTDKDLFIAAGYKPGPNQSLVFNSDIHIGGPWGKPLGFNGTDYLLAKTTLENSNNYSLDYNYSHDGFLNQIKVSGFYSNNHRELEKKYFTIAGNILSFKELTHFTDYYYGTKIIGNLRISGTANIRIGTDFYSFHISTPVDGIDYIEKMEYSNRMSIDARSYTSGLFAETEYLITQNIKLSGGIRYDFSKVFEGEAYNLEQNGERNTTNGNFSGNFSARFTTGNNFSLKINFARAFRMPETTELFTDNYTSNGILYGNPDLKPEHSYSLDICANIKRKHFELELSPFLWLMDDMISKMEIKGRPGTSYQYTNIGRSRLFGGEITAGLPWENVFESRDKLNFSIAASYVNGTELTNRTGYLANGIPLDYIPPLNMKSEVAYFRKKSKNVEFNLAFRAIWYTKQNRKPIDAYSTPSYLLIGSSAGILMKKRKSKPSIRLVINNILNKKIYTYQSYLPSAGRDFRLFLTFNLNKE